MQQPSLIPIDPSDLTPYLQQKQPLWNGLAITYTLATYGFGLGLILQPHLWLNGIGVVLLTHSLLLSVYLAHELMHGNVFSSLHWNALVGTLMLWINGSCYVRFQELMRMHIAHHVNRIDYCRFDLLAFLKSLPTALRWCLLALEWLYIPALAFLLKLRLMLAPFRSPHRQADRSRVLLLASTRSCLLIGLGVVSLKALVLYLLAYGVMLHVLRFVDAFQHTYDALPVGAPLPRQIRDVSPEVARTYEQANTFSNVISRRYPWLNWLLLNFGYHNAHHDVIKCPWYYLPQLDQQLYANQVQHYIPWSRLISNYHRFRVSRIFTGQGTVTRQDSNLQVTAFYGAIEVSFLVVPIECDVIPHK